MSWGAARYGIDGPGTALALAGSVGVGRKAEEPAWKEQAMRITGGRFLELNGVERLVLTRHALGHIRTRAGRALSGEQALDLFREAIHVDLNRMVLMGYRPAYGRRMRRGVRSWYFRFALGDTELIAVVSDGRAAGELVWVTTYARNEQTDLYRVVGPGAALPRARRPRHGRRVDRSIDRSIDGAERGRRAPRARSPRRVRAWALAEVRECLETLRQEVHGGMRTVRTPS